MKTKIITLLLLISLPLGAVSTTFSSNGIKISDYNFSLDFDSLSFSYNKNGFQVGKINLFSLSELLYPFDYIWEGKVERNRTNNQNGISYNSDNVDFFLPCVAFGLINLLNGLTSIRNLYILSPCL